MPQLPRVPHLDYEEHAIALVMAAFRTTLDSLACSFASTEKEQLEVVYIVAADLEKEKGQGVIQCRAELHVPAGTLRLNPIGWTFLTRKDSSRREKMERNLKLKT